MTASIYYVGILRMSRFPNRFRTRVLFYKNRARMKKCLLYTNDVVIYFKGSRDRVRRLTQLSCVLGDIFWFEKLKLFREKLKRITRREYSNLYTTYVPLYILSRYANRLCRIFRTRVPCDGSLDPSLFER